MRRLPMTDPRSLALLRTVDVSSGQRVEPTRDFSPHWDRSSTLAERLKVALFMTLETCRIAVHATIASSNYKEHAMRTHAATPRAIPADRDSVQPVSNAVLWSMVENVETNVMFADRDMVITYMNPASLQTLRSLEAVLPVPADKVVGSSLDIFHKHPAHQQRLLSDANNLPRRAQVTLGFETLDLQITAMIGPTGEYLGAMATWGVVTGRARLDREISRITSMIENAPVNMMFADRNMVITYMNPASLQTLRSLEAVLPVPADKVVGSSLDIFHKHPAHQRQILANETSLPRHANITVGNEIPDHLVTPITDVTGEYIGAMATWEVITERLALEAQKVGADTMRALLSQIGEHATSLAGASEELGATAAQMSAGAEETSGQSGVVSSGSAQVAASIESVRADVGLDRRDRTERLGIRTHRHGGGCRRRGD